MTDALRAFLDTSLAPLVKALLDPVHAFLNGLPPSVWRLAVCGYLVVGTLWAVGLKKSFVLEGAPSPAAWRDLRWWLPLLLVPYLLAYLVF
jgi:hypothetical protein